MKLALFALCNFVVALMAVSALAQEYPTIGQLTEDVGDGSMAYDCVLNSVSLSCHFTQVRVSKSAGSPEDQKEKNAEGLLASAAQFCGSDDYQHAIDTAKSGGPVEGVNNDAQRQNLLELFALFEALCRDRTMEAARSIVEENSRRQENTCKVGTYPFVLDFTWNPVTTRWETVSQPNGACGVVTAAFMETDKDPNAVAYDFWTYGQQTLVTNPEGEDPLTGKCADRPNETMHYTWKTRSAFLQCQYVQYSLF